MPEITGRFDTYDVTGSPAMAAETVIATLNGVTTAYPNQRIALEGTVNISPQAAVTEITLKVRRGGLAGTLVGTAADWQPHAAAAFTQAVIPFAISDAPGDIANETYVLTATPANGAGASTVTAVHLSAVAIT